MGHSPSFPFLPSATSVRAINRARIISYVRRQPGVTRAELSRQTGLSKAAVCNLVSELLGEAFLRESEAQVGRERNIGLFLNDRLGVAVGVEVSPEECRGVLTDVEMSVLRRAQRSLTSTRVEEAVEAIVALTGELLRGTDARCLGLGVAVPGPTDAAGRIVEVSEQMGWSDVPLAVRLGERLGCQVTVVNRPRAGALGEHWYGAGVGAKDLLYVSVASGVGVGILLDGRLWAGAFGYSGEFGHITILPDGPQCRCGNRGCLETLASMPAIQKAVEARLRAGAPSSLMHRLGQCGSLSAHDIMLAARDGDTLVLDEVRQASRYLGIGVAALINLFNPEKVIVGGHLADAGEIVLSTVRETVQRRAFPASCAGVQIVRSALGADSPGVGACALVVNRFLAKIEPALQSG